MRMMSEDTISWESLYNLEVATNESIGCNLVRLLRAGGYLIITTPNLANIYNRILLLLGRPLYNYRPLGILPNDDHVTVVNKGQMISILNNLNLEVCFVKGYSYYEQKVCVMPDSPYARSGF